GGTEGAAAAAEGAVARQAGGAVATGELDRAGITGGRIVELVLGGDCEVEGGAGGGAAGGADGEMVGRRGADDDGVAGAGNGGGHRVGGGYRLAAGGRQGDAKGAGAVAQRGVARQGGVGVGAGEVDRTGVAGVHVVVGVERGHGHVETRARGGRARGRDAEVVRRGGADPNGAAGAGDGTRRRVRGGDRLVAGRLEREAVGEGVGAVVTRGERVVRR